MKQILLLTLLFTAPLYSQFDSLLFEKHLSPYKYGVVALGDQNNDSFDDILVYDCKESKALIFFGGNPMDTIPDWQKTIIQRSIVAMDANGDSIKDIIIVYQDTMDSNQKGKVNIYFGGSLLDTIPDIHFEAPKGSGYNFGWDMYVSPDFDGDRNNELIIYDAEYPFNGGITFFGIFYFYNTNPFDTIPFTTIKGDTLNNVRLYGSQLTCGDLNNDGLTDLAISGGAWSGPANEFIKFYKGNSDWNTDPFVTFYQYEHAFDPTGMRIIEDINGDKKDDILMYSYGGFYPYYYGNVILYGDIPVDTIPDIGLNTQNSVIVRDNLVSPGDVNGDGYNDIIGGVTVGPGPEEARLWIGGNPTPDLPKQGWGGDFNGYGRLIAKVGDINGDGLCDICVGQAFNDCIANGFVRIYAGDTLFRQPNEVKDLGSLLQDFYLDNPYPNPFNPAVNIKYTVSNRQFITIKVYDILGREITTLINQEKPAGEYKIIFNAVKYNLPSGVYFIRMEAKGVSNKIYSSTKKIILIK